MGYNYAAICVEKPEPKIAVVTLSGEGPNGSTVMQ